MEDAYFDEPEYPFFDKLKKCVALFINLSVALLLAFIIIRILEFAYTGTTKQLPGEFFKVLQVALLFDIIFWLKLLPFVFIAFLLIFFIARDKRTNYRGYSSIGTVIIIAYLCLIKYFATALVPLGSDLFGYSLQEIRQTIGTGAKIDAGSILIFIIAIAAFWLLADFFYRKQYINRFYSLCIFFAGMAVTYFDVPAIPKITWFKSEYSYNFSLNKSAFFLERTRAFYADNDPEVDIYAINYIDDFETDSLAGYKPFTYVDEQYPFLHKDETPDVLGNFFNIDSAGAPNIVFIQVEGLGRAFSGPHAYLKSFTPFLDQLAKKSLYWENFLASQGRTFASLPSVLGSLPFANEGFADLGKKMPPHLTLLNILEKNGYDTRFYSGFDPAFDNEAIFLKRQGINVMIGEKDYDKTFVKTPPNAGFTWGYPDREVMRKSLQMESSLQHEQPHISYIQTVTMHTPYTMPEQDVYRQQFEQYLDKLNVNESQKKEYRQYRDIYSTILYTDAALQYFFTEYAKLPSYKNTIFIITGDHRLPEIPIVTKIDRYHVPLLIYSPLLKRTASFRSVSSHLDITPTLLSFLKNNYKIKTPEIASWVGSGIDTARNLRNIHKYPLKQTKNDLNNYISGLYFTDQDVLFSIKENLEIEPLTDENKLSEIKSEFNRYKTQNDRFIRSRKLIPDTLYNKFK